MLLPSRRRHSVSSQAAANREREREGGSEGGREGETESKKKAQVDSGCRHSYQKHSAGLAQATRDKAVPVTPMKL